MFTDNLTILFKLLTVIHYCRYKMHTYYVATFRLAKPHIRWLMLLLEGFAVFIYFGAMLAFCSSVSGHTWIWIDLTPQILYNVFLMCFSFFLVRLLSSKMSFGTIRRRKKWLYLMEFFI